MDIVVRFLQPGMGYLFGLLPILIILWYVQIRLKQTFRDNSGFQNAINNLSEITTLRRDFTIIGLVLVSTVTLILAVMHPQAYFETTSPEYEREDLILLLDRSASMNANDILPSRLDRAVDEIKAFISEKPDQVDRIAIVGFAGTPMVLSYFTSDIDTLLFFMEWIREDPQLYFGTNFTEALSQARDVVENDNTPTRKIFLLLSDGDDQSMELSRVLEDLQQQNIQVHTIGIGSDIPAPIPVSRQNSDDFFLEDEDGQNVITSLNEATLRRVAAATSGSYFRSLTGRDLASTIQNIITRERRQVGWTNLQDFRDIYHPLLILSCISTFFLILRI